MLDNQIVTNNKLDKDLYWRTPLYVLNDLIVNQTYEDIGGNIQLASISSNGYSQLYAISPNIAIDEPILDKYQNIDIREHIGWQVGECLIAIPSRL